VAAQDLAYFPAWQRPDGLFISRPGEYDGIGEALWAIGRHAELTGDAAFARRAEHRFPTPDRVHPDGITSPPPTGVSTRNWARQPSPSARHAAQVCG
jgi:hypothetical protein